MFAEQALSTEPSFQSQSQRFWSASILQERSHLQTLVDSSVKEGPTLVTGGGAQGRGSHKGRNISSRLVLGEEGIMKVGTFPAIPTISVNSVSYLLESSEQGAEAGFLGETKRQT